jgi:hypothetical protein
MKELVLTEDAVKLLIESVEDEIRDWQEHNDILVMHGIDDKVRYYVDKNNIKIGELKTLLNYLKSL